MMPRCDQILAILGDRADDIRALHIRSLALFGSVARGQARADSDVDLLVEFDGPYTLFDLCRAEEALSRWTGFPVDLVPRAQLRPEITDAVDRDAIRAA